MLKGTIGPTISVPGPEPTLVLGSAYAVAIKSPNNRIVAETLTYPIPERFHALAPLINQELAKLTRRFPACHCIVAFPSSEIQAANLDAWLPPIPLFMEYGGWRTFTKIPLRPIAAIDEPFVLETRHDTSLLRAGSVALSVVWSNGMPVDDTMVRLQLLKGERPYYRRFRFQKKLLVPCGTYRLASHNLAIRRLLSNTASFEVKPGEELNKDIKLIDTLRPIQVSFVDVDDSPIPNCSLEVRSGESPIEVGWVPGKTSIVWIPADRYVEFRGSAAGYLDARDTVAPTSDLSQAKIALRFVSK